MKRFWQSWLAMVAVATMAGSANAQWNNQSADIGSYQSILSRAGYSGQNTQMPGQLPAQMSNQMPVPSPPGAPMAYGGQMHGAPQGMQTQGMQTQGQAMQGQAMGAPMMVGDGCGTPDCGGMVQGGYAVPQGGMVQGGAANCGGASYVDYGYANNQPVYSPGQSIGGSGLSRLIGGGGNANWVGGVFGLVLRRDYEDAVRLGGNAGGMELFSTDVTNGDFSGLGVSLAKRNCNGSGIEALYWGLEEADDITLAGPTYTSIGGLADLNHVPSGATMFDIYNAGDDVRLYRDTEIHNLELNMLRNGGQYTTRTGAAGNYELLAGFRLFQFNEDLRYVSNSSAAGYPMTSEYALNADNTLTGFQVGGRNEICLSQRLRLSHAATVGIFNNRAKTRQRIFDENDYSPLVGSGPAAGRSFDYGDTKNDAAFLGQIDLGLIYQFTQKARARIGYRALGVAGVALAADQIPVDFTDPHQLQRANTNGSLLLHGLYFGTEFCF